MIQFLEFQQIYWCQPIFSSEQFLICFGLRTLAPNTVSLYFKKIGRALSWVPSQMITCHPKKIQKFLLKRGVVQFFRLKISFWICTWLASMSGILYIINCLASKSAYGYDKVSDVPESRVLFASKNLTPCRMH